MSDPAAHVAALRIISNQMREEGEHFHTDSYGIEALALSNAADLIEAQAKEIARLRVMVKDAYNEGFMQGLRDYTSSRGGIPWHVSRFRAALQEPQL